MASTRVVLPWSTCATMATLRSSAPVSRPRAAPGWRTGPSARRPRGWMLRKSQLKVAGPATRAFPDVSAASPHRPPHLLVPGGSSVVRVAAGRDAPTPSSAPFPPPPGRGCGCARRADRNRHRGRPGRPRSGERAPSAARRRLRAWHGPSAARPRRRGDGRPRRSWRRPALVIDCWERTAVGRAVEGSGPAILAVSRGDRRACQRPTRVRESVRPTVIAIREPELRAPHGPPFPDDDLEPYCPRRRTWRGRSRRARARGRPVRSCHV